MPRHLRTYACRGAPDPSLRLAASSMVTRNVLLNNVTLSFGSEESYAKTVRIVSPDMVPVHISGDVVKKPVPVSQITGGCPSDREHSTFVSC